LGLFIWLLAQQDWNTAWKAISQLPLWLVLLALAMFVFRILLTGLRWQILLRSAEIRIPIIETEKIVFLGLFVSNFLPSTIGGDTVRFLSLLRYTNRRALALASVVLDRLINVVAMFSVIPFTLKTFGPSIINLLGNSQGIIPGGFALAAARGGWLGRISSKLKYWIAYSIETFRVWFHNPFSLLLAFIVSWSAILTYFLAIWILARGLGMEIALYQVMGTTTITYLITLLPISVNGYGVREIAITTLYMQLGASLEQATALAIVSRALMLITTLPGALWISPIISGDLKNSTLDTNNEETVSP